MAMDARGIRQGERGKARPLGTRGKLAKYPMPRCPIMVGCWKGFMLIDTQLIILPVTTKGRAEKGKRKVLGPFDSGMLTPLRTHFRLTLCVIPENAPAGTINDAGDMATRGARVGSENILRTLVRPPLTYTQVISSRIHILLPRRERQRTAWKRRSHRRTVCNL